MELNNLHVYEHAMRLAETIWSEVENWNRFDRNALGHQLVRAADSIAANISEGHGRYHFGERRQFCYYARGSLQETLTWLAKAERRDLFDTEQAVNLRREVDVIGRMLNAYIRTIGRSPSDKNRSQ